MGTPLGPEYMQYSYMEPLGEDSSTYHAGTWNLAVSSTAQQGRFVST